MSEDEEKHNRKGGDQRSDRGNPRPAHAVRVADIRRRAIGQKVALSGFALDHPRGRCRFDLFKCADESQRAVRVQCHGLPLECRRRDQNNQPAQGLKHGGLARHRLFGDAVTFPQVHRQAERSDNMGGKDLHFLVVELNPVAQEVFDELD